MVLLTLFGCKKNEVVEEINADWDDFDLIGNVASVKETTKMFGPNGLLVDNSPNMTDFFETVLEFDQNGLLKEKKILKLNGELHERYLYNGMNKLLLLEQYKDNELFFVTKYSYTASGILSRWVKRNTSGEELEVKEFKFKDGKVIAEIRKNSGIQHEIRYEHNGDRIVSEERYTNQRLKSRTEFIYDTHGHKIEEATYDANGDLMYYVQYEYENDLLILELYRNKAQEITRKVTFQYDENQNVVFMSIFDSDQIETIETNSYNEQNLLIEQSITENGNEIWRQNYTYNDNGKVIESVSFDGVNRESIAYEYSYDDHGNWIQRVLILNGKPYQALKRSIEYSK